MSGVQDTLKDGLTPMADTSTVRGAPIPVPGRQNSYHGTTSLRYGVDAFQSARSVSKSWGHNVAASSAKAGISFLSVGHIRRATFSQVISPKIIIPEKMVTAFDEIAEESDESCIHFEPELVKQFVAHVLVYADMLFGWQLFHKRVEMLKSVDQEIQKMVPPYFHSGFEQRIGVVVACERCRNVFRSNETVCSTCTSRSKLPQCTICRLPTKGLSRTCPSCLHVTHLNCWNVSKMSSCAAGCGCPCFVGSIKKQDSTRPVRSPNSVLSALPSHS